MDKGNSSCQSSTELGWVGHGLSQSPGGPSSEYQSSIHIWWAQSRRNLSLAAYSSDRLSQVSQSMRYNDTSMGYSIHTSLILPRLSGPERWAQSVWTAAFYSAHKLRDAKMVKFELGSAHDHRYFLQTTFNDMTSLTEWASACARTHR